MIARGHLASNEAPVRFSQKHRGAADPWALRETQTDAPRRARSVQGRVRAAVLICALGLVLGCTPTGGVSVGSDGGVAGGVGVETGRVSAGVNTNGDVGARVDVVNQPNASVSVGTGGASASVRPGGGALRVGIGRGGVRLGF